MSNIYSFKVRGRHGFVTSLNWVYEFLGLRDSMTSDYISIVFQEAGWCWMPRYLKLSIIPFKFLPIDRVVLHHINIVTLLPWCLFEEIFVVGLISASYHQNKSVKRILRVCLQTNTMPSPLLVHVQVQHQLSVLCIEQESIIVCMGKLFWQRILWVLFSGILTTQKQNVILKLNCGKVFEPIWNLLHMLEWNLFSFVVVKVG